MKTLTWFLLVAMGAALNTQASGHRHWAVEESQTLDWNDDGKADRIAIEVADLDGTATGERRLRINVSGHKPWVHSCELLGCTAFDDPKKPEYGKVDTEVTSENLLSSTHLLLLPFDGAMARNRILFIFGEYNGPEEWGSVTAIALNDGGVPVIAMKLKEFHIKAIDNIDGRDHSALIGIPCVAQAVEFDSSSYTPSLVYRWDRKSTRLNLSLPLSKKYNAKFHYPWYGPECSERIVKNGDAGREDHQPPPQQK